MPRGTNDAEALPRGAAQVDGDGVVREAVAAPTLRERGAEHGADGAVDVAHRPLDLDAFAALERGLGLRDELLVEGDFEAVVLRLGAEEVLALVRVLGDGEDRREVEAVRLPVVDRLAGVEHLGVADGLRDRAEAERGEVLAHLLGDEFEEVDDELGLAREALAQLRVLGGDPDRARVEVTDPHHHAAAHHERCGGEAELLGTEQRRDQHVTTGLQLAVALHDDAVAQAVGDERLLRLGDPELHGAPACFSDVSGAAPVPPSCPEMSTTSECALATPAATVPTPISATSFTWTRAAGVAVLEVVDELLDVFDRVDVVVRRRADEAHARRRVPGLGDPRVDLRPRQLTALARLRALRHLDLQVVGIHQVLGRDAEAPRHDLLDRGTAEVTVGVGGEAVGVFAALAGVRLAADAVHGDGEVLVRLGRDRAVRHGAGHEPLHDLADRLNLVDRDRLAHALAQLEQAAQRGETRRLRVDHAVYSL